MDMRDYNDGKLATFYTLKGWFVSIKPAYRIDKVQFDFVKKGTAAQNAFSVYVDIDRFDLLCDDILSGQFKRALETDKGNDNPSAWKFTTGEDGSRSVSIGAGRRTPIVIQGRDRKKEVMGVVGLTGYDDLRILAKDFRRTSEAYFQERSKKCLDAANRYSKDHSADELY